MRAAYQALSDIEGEWTDAIGADALVQLRDGLAQVRALQEARP